MRSSVDQSASATHKPTTSGLAARISLRIRDLAEIALDSFRHAPALNRDILECSPVAVERRLLWDFDTARTYQTVNGVVAVGGSLDGAGPVIAGGMIFANSGYARFGGMPGNVLLA